MTKKTSQEIKKKKPAPKQKKMKPLLILVGKKKQAKAHWTEKVLASVARGTSDTCGGQPRPAVHGNRPGLRNVGILFSAQNLNQSGTNCFFEKRCLLNNFNCHKMTKMGFKN